ncbi:MAG: alpha/beta hydrolase [Nostoc sp.]|uniref:alpha/beta fold hydrolase n=1 Tax=unclassified Nostoc TaxID=2593658 RepID=UPI0025EAC561|nr:alpha/beta hydrolase [Nostoc sp. NMS9]MBN3938576.1 alpha/beta hydrolase [Nostoc sp. NMS9]
MKNNLFTRRKLLNVGILVGLGLTTAPMIALAKPKKDLHQTKETKVVANNIVLVHGAFADGSSWSKVIPLLQDKGLRVTAVQIPLTSLADDVAVVKQVLAAQTGSIILVGHSYGGAVITEAAANAANVVGLVYIAGHAPDKGESLSDLNKRFPTPPGSSHIHSIYNNKFLQVDPDTFQEVFAQDVDAVEARVMAAVQKPIAIKNFSEKVSQAAWKSKRSWYLVSANDRMISPELERFMAKRIGATVISLPSSHVSMVSHPTEVANLIIEAAKAEEPQAKVH